MPQTTEYLSWVLMAAPRYVSPAADACAQSYASPDVVPPHWHPNRPADLSSGQPTGGSLGHQGPDQGYALKLTNLFDTQIALTNTDRVNGVAHADVHAGCVQVALKRASLLGRAPVVYDLEIAYRCWGWLDDAAAPELVALRGDYFHGVAGSHHYQQARWLVAAVPATVLVLSPTEIARQYDTDWRSLLAISALTGGQ